MNPTIELQQKRALGAGLFSYVCWGFFPIYWKFLSRISATEILAHRMIWSCVFYLGIYSLSSWKQQTFRQLFQQELSQWLAAGLAALVLAINWGIYIYAVNSGQIVQGSLAYFINPLMNVAVGVIFFKERFPTILKVALGFALAGVLVQVGFAPSFPWIALTLATTFCIYGVIKKTRLIPPDLSSAMEGLASLLPALCLAWFYRQESSYVIFTHEWLLLIGSGVVTGLPLFLFSMAAQALPYSLIGMMQFIAPSLQFLVGILIFGEKLSPSGFISFLLIWLGAGFYFFHLLRKAKTDLKLRIAAKKAVG